MRMTSRNAAVTYFAPASTFHSFHLLLESLFFRRFRLGMSETADRATKTAEVVNPVWIERLATVGLIDAECHQQLRGQKAFLSRFFSKIFEFRLSGLKTALS